MSKKARLSTLRGLLSFLCASVMCIMARAQSPVPGQNINMVSGTKWPGGDPFLQRQNEPSIAVSTRNSRHLLAGANDYRTVDLNFLATGETGDAWLGIFKSFDAGASWQSTLLPGYPLDQTPEGQFSPLKGLPTASDPVVRAGTNGLFFYSGIAFNRGTNQGVVFVARLIDLNNKENGDATTTTISSNQDPIRYVNTVVIDTGNAGQFFDKPWVAVDIPRFGAGSCTLTVSEAGAPGGTVTQSFPAGNVYLAYSRFVGNNNLIRSQLFLSRSLDCGATWSKPTMLSQTFPLNQGVTIAIDPETGFVYVAWRGFAAASQPDEIVVAKSTDGGQTFSQGSVVVALPSFSTTNPTGPSFFDQGTTGTSIRTNAFPALTVDDSGMPGVPGRLYIAWSQRGVATSGGILTPDARIMMSTSLDGLNWSPPFAIDNQPTSDDAGNTFPRGHQFMPQLTFSGGKLMALYYDLRLDHTSGSFTPNSSCPFGVFFCPDVKGKFYAEARNLKGELVGNPQNPAVFTPFLDDAGLTARRHTIEVFVGQANPGSPPTFTPGTRVTNYRFGLREDFFDESGKLQQLQVDPPNFPLFQGGTVPFFGDYVDIAALSMVPQSGGSWAFNTRALRAPVYHATWTDNRDVRPPANGNWQNYTPVGGGGPSIFSPGATTPTCVPNQEGMRNQNIYTSRITQGLAVSSPQNSKPLSASLQRAFVVLVQNQTNFDKTFRLTIANQPPGSPTNGFASFTAGTNNPGPTPPAGPPTPPSPATTTLDVQIAAHSGIARPVFAFSSSSPTASITVNVDEIMASGGSLVTGGLSSFVVLNPDPTSPAVINPDGTPVNTDIASLEIYNPNISNPNISNPNISNPNISNPNISNPNISNPNISNPNISNPDIATPNISNPNISNPNISNPNISNPNISNPNISNTAVSDATYTVTNKGNTSASYDVKLAQIGNLPSNSQFQLTLSKSYLTPVASNCTLFQEPTNILLTNINSPAFVGTQTNFSDPNISNPNISNATIALAPGETAFLTLRGNNVTCNIGSGPRCQGPISGVPMMEDIVANVVVPVVTSQAANTNDPTNTPQFAPPGGVFILTTTLPDGVVGAAYSQTLQAISGNPPLTWQNPGGGLTPGLSLNGSTGVISGSPTAAGTFTFTIQVTDSALNTATRSLSIRIANPLVITTSSLPTAIQGASYSTTLSATGGTPPLTWSLVSGSLDGLTLASSGNLTGTPVAIGSFPFTVAVADLASPAQSVTKSFTLQVVTPLPPPPVTPFFGQTTDPLGDSNGGGSNPDLVWASTTVSSNGTVKLMVRYASGTFSSSVTEAQFLLDTDQNPATGSPGSNSGCIDDAANLGMDYLVVLRSAFASNQATISKAMGGCNQFAVLGTAPVTIFTDGMDVTFPLSTLVNTATSNTSGPATSGPWNFKVTTDFSIGGNNFSGLKDTMPNIGLAAASTASAPLPTSAPSGMVAWWPADGYPTDIQGNHGQVLTNITYAPSEVGQSFVFNGTSSSITITDSGDLTPAAVTVDFWFKSNVNLSGNPVVPFLFKLNPADDALFSSKGYDFFYQFGGLGFGLAGPGGARFFAQVGATFTAGTWHHVAGTYDPGAPAGTAQKLYLDGVLVSSTCGPSTTGPTFNPNPSSTNCTPASINYQPAAIEVGTVIDSASFPPSQTTPYFFNGQIDEIEIFNRALSASEIQAIFNAGSAGKSKP